MSHNPLPNKERMKLPRQPMPERAPEERAKSFTEVNVGYDPDLARTEALRCLACQKPTCVTSCPVGVKVKDFIDLILAGDYLGAAAKIREDDVLPAITGRVCPQEDQCESGCVVGRKMLPVGIGHLERFVADYEQRIGKVGLPPRAPATGKKVAIVGSGPAGLSCAGGLVQRGHEVRVFEALHDLGGVLAYGIPEFRLPRTILKQEIENLRKMGVEFETNVVVGRTVTIDELFGEEGYHAVFIATGAGAPQFMKVPGENLNGVYSANEFLTRVNLMRAYRFPEYDQPVYDCKGQEVAVIGGGNTALDAARTALRLGAKRVNLIYRRSEKEMPGRAEEIHHAKDEGIQIVTLTNPVAYLGEERVQAVRAIRMELGEPDSSGRRPPIPIPGSEFEIPASVVIVAIGTSANPLVQATTPGLKTNKRNYIEANPATLRTSRQGVFAGGDIVTGAATVILAMGAGRKAAASIHNYLTTGLWEAAPAAQAAAVQPV
ncbi:MAG TPA: NADPH-dependent glutamate synthase [Terriglobales bacterium]|nr:NADPH-dependent glutamate synthase [Terriglobales bacterium]